MSLVNVFEGDNIGSIASIEIAYHTDFSGWFPSKFFEGKAWQRICLMGEIAEFKCKIKNDPNGIIYAYSGFFDIHSIRDEVEQNLLPFVGTHAVLRITDNNGRIYIIGKPENPVTLEVESTTGKTYKNKNGYVFNFSVNQISPAEAVI